MEEEAGGGRWVFGYGSLMWRPGFAFIERRSALLHGRRRAFCIYSVHHRGTYERPGLVLGLAPGGSVRGAAYRVDERHWADVYAYLREREQPTETYFEAWREVKIDGADRASALTFLSDTAHPQWAGALTLEQQADLIAGATGLSGRNIDYLRDLVMHLHEDGVRDHGMERLLRMVEERESPSPWRGEGFGMGAGDSPQPLPSASEAEAAPPPSPALPPSRGKGD